MLAVTQGSGIFKGLAVYKWIGNFLAVKINKLGYKGIGILVSVEIYCLGAVFELTDNRRSI